eukprot:jgi/Tetstr1/454407/TSEL_041308.t1
MVVGALGIKGSENLFTQWNSTFATYLTDNAGVRLNKTFRLVYLDFDTAYRATQDKCVDFVFSNPSMHLCLELQYQVTPLATLLNYRNGFKLDKFYGTIFTRSDRDDINTLDDLKGKIVEAVSVTGLGACQLQWHELQRNGIDFMNDPKQVRFSYNQKATVKAVIAGAADVGMVRTDMAEGMDANGEIDIANIKVIHVQEDPEFPFPYSTSLAAPEWPLAHLPHVPTSTLFLMSNTLTEMPTESQAAQEGLYAGWVPPVTYMSLFTMMGDLGFLTNNRCSGNSDTYESITCPADTAKVPEDEIKSNCDELAEQDTKYACPEGYICVCSPCAAAAAHEASSGGANTALIAGITVAVLVAVAAVAAGVWYRRRVRAADEERAVKQHGRGSREYDSTAESWNDLNEMVGQLTAKGKPKPQEGDVTVQELLASGGNARVYRALWRGATVAQKRIQLPSSLSALQKKKTSLAMEAAISTSMSHPNVVHTYHWEMVPIRKSMAASMSEKRVARTSTAPNLKGRVDGTDEEIEDENEIVMWEMRIIQEFCELGSVTHCLHKGLLPGQTGSRTPPELKTSLQLSKDVACGMLHIHSMQIIHSDLKSGNVLLVESRRGDASSVAKIADFGLSVKMDEDQTHVSGVHAGTLSHMSPELLLQGHAGKAADVYAFGLASDCWHHDAEKRPAFDEICDRITDMLSELTMEHVADLTNGASEQTESTCESIKSLQKQSVTGGQTLERLTKARPSREKSLRKLAEEASPGRDNFTDEDTDDDEDEDNPTVMFDQGGFATRNSEDVPTNL